MVLEWSRFVGFLALTVSGLLKDWGFVVVFGILLRWIGFSFEWVSLWF
jgi:hypothetical protein